MNGHFKGRENEYMLVGTGTRNCQALVNNYQLFHIGLGPDFTPLTSEVGGECVTNYTTKLSSYWLSRCIFLLELD